MFNLANILTLGRLVFLPLILICLYLSNFTLIMVAFGIYVLGSLTDFLDGWVARKYNMITPFGTFLDPIADKIYVGCILVMLVGMNHISGIWIMLVVMILAREFMVSGLREFLGPYNVKFPVTVLAKWKTTVQMVALGVLILAPYVAYTEEVGLGLLTVATILTVITGWIYLKSGLEHICKMS